MATEEEIRKAEACLDKYEDELRERIDKLNSYKEEQHTIIALMEAFPQLENVQVQFTLDSGTFGGLICTTDVEQLKVLVEPLRFLRERLGAFTVTDDPDIRRRIYKFRDNRVTFQAWFWSNENKEGACKYVQTGVKQVPVFELRCGDASVAQEDVDV